MENNIPNRFYRTSAKALILNEARDKFLIVQEEDGKWELPGGGIDWGETAHECLVREVLEEMNVPVTWISPTPSYFLTWTKNEAKPFWVANVFYETEVEHLNFTPSDECIAYEFVSKESFGDRASYPNVPLLLDMFDPKNHIRQ